MKIIKFSNFINESSSIELHYSAFDWDDNILHMPTKILMDEKIRGEWVPVDVSTNEFAKIRNNKERFRLRDNDPSIAFSEFRDTGDRGQDAFLEDTKKSISMMDFAPAWNHFIDIIMEASIFAIITARGHEPETMKSCIEWIIDNYLTDDQRFIMYNNCLKHAYIFSDQEIEKYERIPKGNVTKTPLIQNWLNACEFYGVSSESFAKEFGEASAQNPEKAKEMALDKFLKKCNYFAKKIGAKSVSIGFSDDDPKNVEHISMFFKEKSALTNEFGPIMKLNLYKTTEKNKIGGERSKFVSGEEIKLEWASHQAWGTENSVLPFTKWNNMTTYHYPNTFDSPKDNFHHMLKINTNQAISLAKNFSFKRKKRLSKQLENYGYGEMNREEMLNHICNYGWEREELEDMNDEMLYKICRKLPKSTTESKK